MQINFRSLLLTVGILIFIATPSVRLFAQVDDVPNDPTTAMTIESGDPTFGSDDPNDQDVPADANYAQPQEPFASDLPETVSNYEGPVGVTGIFNGNVDTACSYDPLGHSAHRAIDDIVVQGSIGKYPLKMTRYYNSRQQYYATPSAIGLSPGWSHEYAWLLWAAGHKVVSPHGNVYDDYCGAPVGVSERWENRADAYNGTWRLADGGKVVFSGGRVTDIYDPYSQRTRIAYDGSGQRVKVTEPGGRCLWFTYSAQDQDGTKLLTWVQAYDVDGSPGSPTLPTGHVIAWVNYTYTSVSPGVQGRDKKMLTGAAYSDGTSATYQYRTDNVTESPTTHKMYPLLKRCDDVRYNGPMRTIWYDYQNAGPHGAIIDEKYPGIGAVSAISPGVPVNGYTDSFTEMRGDGSNPTRTFNYTHIRKCQGVECGPCDDEGTNGPNQQMLLNYTDFRGQTTVLGYDGNWYINSVRDTNIHTTGYTRGAPPPNGIGEITQITYPGGAHINYGYESPPQYPRYEPHYITSITNERSKTTTYTRDANHRVTRIDYPSDQYTPASYETFTYNGFGQVLNHRLKNGAYESFAYNTRGLLTDKWNPKQTVPSGSDPHTHYDYYTSGWWTDRVKIETLPANTSGATARETYEYDRNAGSAACSGRGLVTKITHADAKYRKSGYTQFGNKLWEENELIQRTSYTYDNYNRMLTAKDPLIHTTNYDYSPNEGNTTQRYLHTTNSQYWVTTPASVKTHNVFDPNWRKTSTTVAYGTASAATTSFDYDNVGNLTQVTDPRSKITKNGYDARNRKTSTTEAFGTNVQATTVWHYDTASNIFQIDRPDGTSETKGFDALNRMLWDKVPYWWTTPPEYHTTWFAYNPSGTVQSVRDPKGQTTGFAYNASDEKITMTYPGGTQSQSWTYDNAHNPASRTTVGGKTQTFTYDNRNRKIAMTWSNGADSGTYGYDDAGRLTSATNPNSAVTRTYYADGRLQHDYQAVTGLGSTKDVYYATYNADGNLTRMNVAGVSPSYDYTFGYDPMGRFETIAPNGGSVAFKYAYDNASNVTHRYTTLPGSVTVDQSTPHDSLNRIYGRWLYKNGTAFAAQGYTYDRMNRLTAVTWGSVKDTYSYYWDGELMYAQYVVPVDGPNQVQEGGDPDLDSTGGVDPWANYQPPDTEEAEPAPPPDDSGSDSADTLAGLQSLETPGAQRIIGYGYDKAGNRWATNDSGTGGTLYYVNSLNQYTGVGGTNNVVNGSEHEIQTYQGNTYTYINDEHLKQVTSGSNTYNLYYDALGRCVKRTLGTVTTYYIYDGEKPVLDYMSTDLTHPARNLYGKGIDEILMRTDPSVNSGQPFYYGQDHEGSVTHLINTSGNVIENYLYDAYGAITKMWTNGTLTDHTGYNNRFLFTGREYAGTYQGTYVPAFTFYEYRARAFHPGLGRFMSEDPKLFDAGDYNFFRYCHNDPVDLTDPMGLELDTSRLDAHDWQMTRSYLMQSPTYRNIVLRAEALSQKIVVAPRTDHRDFVAKGDPTTIHWDPHSALRTGDGGRQSPALGLGHELDHAFRRETDRKGYERDRFVRDKEYGNREDRRVMQNEARGARELGEDVRSQHKADPRDRYRVASPISRDPAPTASDAERRATEQGTKKAQETMSDALYGLQRKSP
jgi:RHS repeat-associated protein